MRPSVVHLRGGSGLSGSSAFELEGRRALIALVEIIGSGSVMVAVEGVLISYNHSYRSR